MSEYFGAPWVGVDIDLLGRHESDAELNKRLAPHWKAVGLPGYKSLVGNKRAWCALRVDYAYMKVGIKGPGSAGAYKSSTFGQSCPFWFGALMPIKHRSGGRHTCFFLYWIDEAKKIAATLDGNRSNRFAVNVTNLSGQGDTLVGGPRGPKGWKGVSVSKADVLAKYPMLKVGGHSGTGTR